MRGSAELAVQAVNYRTRAYLERCVATVVSDLERSGIEFEINLLDNASGEDLSDFSRRFPACETFASTTNLGFGGGHNLLATKTEAPNLLILNPDVEFIAADTTRRLLDALTGAEAVKAVGPKLINADGLAQAYDHGRLRGLRAQIALRGGHSYWRETGVRQEVAWVSGAVLMIKRGAWQAVGGFDDRLFLYKEEEDLCLRLRRAGGQVLYVPEVVVLHHGSVVADRDAEFSRSASYYAAKNFPNRHSRRMFAAVHECLGHLRL